MLEAMKSLLGGSIGSSVSQQPPIQLQKKNNQQKKYAAGKPNINPAVELNISSKAKRIMEAIENGQLKFDDKGQIYRNMSNTGNIAIKNKKQMGVKNNIDITQGIIEENSALKKLNILIKSFIDDINKNIKSKELSSETVRINQLFEQIETIFNEDKNNIDIAPVNNDKQLSLYDKSKAIILFSELNRILGNVGVFFGRDLSLVKMSITAQNESLKMISELSNILGQDKVNSINSNQAAHIDAIFRELEQIYMASRNKIEIINE